MMSNEFNGQYRKWIPLVANKWVNHVTRGNNATRRIPISPECENTVPMPSTRIRCRPQGTIAEVLL